MYEITLALGVKYPDFPSARQKSVQNPIVGRNCESWYLTRVFGRLDFKIAISGSLCKVKIVQTLVMFYHILPMFIKLTSIGRENTYSFVGMASTPSRTDCPSGVELDYGVVAV